MPTSHPHQLNEIVNLIGIAKPQSVLDIGVGFGKYGVLAREYLEFSGEELSYGQWTHRVDGIEAFPDYLTPLHEFIYDEVFVGDALEILPRLETRYDLILLIDVLEHFEEEDGHKLLDLVRARARNAIVSTPHDAGPQQTTYENEYETHRSQWRARDLLARGNAFVISNRASILGFVGEDAPRVRKRFRRQRWTTRFRERLPRVASLQRRLKRLARQVFPKRRRQDSPQKRRNAEKNVEDAGT